MTAVDVFDVVVIGSGAAGLQCAIYCATEGLSCLVLEKSSRPGGQAATSSHIENFAGYSESGHAIMEKMLKQARAFGAKLVLGQEVTKLTPIEGGPWVITVASGLSVSGRCVVLATGQDATGLGIDGECSLSGVYWGSDLRHVPRCKGRPAVVVGGGNSAGQLALYLSKFASAVTIVVRGDTLELTMSEYLSRRIETSDSISVKTHSEVLFCHEHETMRGYLGSVSICDGHSVYQQEACAMFICIGAKPKTDWLEGVAARDQKGYLLSDQTFQATGSAEGLFVIGDARANSIKRIATAVGEGASVMQDIHNFLAKVKQP